SAPGPWSRYCWHRNSSVRIFTTSSMAPRVYWAIPRTPSVSITTRAITPLRPSLVAPRVGGMPGRRWCRTRGLCGRLLLVGLHLRPHREEVDLASKALGLGAPHAQRGSVAVCLRAFPFGPASPGQELVAYPPHLVAELADPVGDLAQLGRRERGSRCGHNGLLDSLAAPSGTGADQHLPAAGHLGGAFGQLRLQ